MGKTKKDNKYEKDFAVKKPTRPIAKKKDRKPSKSSVNDFDDDELMDMEGLDDLSFMGNDFYEEEDDE